MEEPEGDPQGSGQSHPADAPTDPLNEADFVDLLGQMRDTIDNYVEKE